MGMTDGELYSRQMRLRDAYISPSASPAKPEPLAPIDAKPISAKQYQLNNQLKLGGNGLKSDPQTRASSADVLGAKRMLNPPPVTSQNASATGAPLAPSPIGGLARTIGASLAGSAAVYGGTVAGSTIANNVSGGNSSGLGASIGGVVGGIAGGFLGATATGAATFGLGTFGGGLLGNAIGSTVGSFLGGLIDNAFGKKTTAVTPSISANTAQSISVPSNVGQGLGVPYRVTVYWSGTSMYDPNFGGGPPAVNVPADFGIILGPIISVGFIQVGINLRQSINGAVGNVYTSGYTVASSYASITRVDGLPESSKGGEPAALPYIPTFTPYVYPPASILINVRGESPSKVGASDLAQTPNPKIAPRENIKPVTTNPPIAPNIAPNIATKSPTAATGKSDPFANGNTPSFTAKPYISGISDPREYGNPVDVHTGLNREQFQQKLQEAGERPAVRAAQFDVIEINKQLDGISTIPSNGLGGKSPQQLAREEYTRSIEGNQIRVDAYNRVANPSNISAPIVQPKVQLNPVASTTPSPDLTAISLGLVGLGVTTGAILTGVDYVRNLNEQINAQTTPASQQTNAKQGVCDAMQPNQCGFQGVVAATNPIKDIATSNAGLLGTILANLGTLATLIVTNFTKLFTFLDINAKVEAVKSTLTLALTIHNALMLSQSLGDTLGLIIDNVLNVFGNTFRSTNGDAISASQYLGAQVQQWIVNVIGAENYVKLNDVFATANRIYQTGMNVVSTMQSILDSAASVAQATGINVAKIGNALRDESVVSPRAYTHMDDTALGNRPTTLSRFTALTTTISDLDTKAQNLVTITAAPIQIKDAVKQSKDDIKAFNDARDGNSVEAKAARDAKLEEIKALKPLTEATVGKRDDDT